MAHVQLTNLSKQFGSTHVLNGIDLQIQDGEFVVLVGPSGCGKSTLLRMMCGLEPITGGEMRIDGEVVNDLPPAKRRIAMVFQSYALYPHMTVFDNMAFGLKLHGSDRAQRQARVTAAAKALHIDHLLGRLPRELSGGQRQRVAIGRAIVRDPKLFLFDEPLSNLDAALRVKTRIELARLHRELKATMVYVTHDQVEAMTLGDKIVVMHEGRVQQAGTPLDLYQRPANRFVAAFIGSPTINLLPAAVAAIAPGRADLTLADGTPVTAAVATDTLATGHAVDVGVRPEHLSVVRSDTPAVDAGARFTGQVTLVEQLGESHLVYVTTASAQELVVRGSAHTRLRPGDAVTLQAPVEALYVFDREGRGCDRVHPEGPSHG